MKNVMVMSLGVLTLDADKSAHLYSSEATGFKTAVKVNIRTDGSRHEELVYVPVVLFEADLLAELRALAHAKVDEIFESVAKAGVW